MPRVLSQDLRERVVAAIEAKDDITLVELQAPLADRDRDAVAFFLTKDRARHRAGPHRRPEAPGRVVRWPA